MTVTHMFLPCAVVATDGDYTTEFNVLSLPLATVAASSLPLDPVATATHIAGALALTMGSAKVTACFTRGI